MTRRAAALRDWLPILIVLAVGLTARASLADHYTVPSGSMRPTVEVGDRILVNKLAYGLRVPLTERYLLARAAPAPGEVVVLASPEDGVVLLKRVVAGPGDLVAVRDGRLWRNGVPVPLAPDGLGWCEGLSGHAHGIRLTRGGGPDLDAIELPPRRYLVLGDNRGESHDGRSFGLVRREAILGQAIGVYWNASGPTWRDL